MAKDLIRMAKTPGVTLVWIETGPGWHIAHHRLFDVSPENADKVEVIGANMTVWDLCFLQDLLLVENKGRGVLVDVGWYPDADPTGTYCLRVIRIHDDGRMGRDSYDWRNPMFKFDTRSLKQLLSKVREIVTEDRTEDYDSATPPMNCPRCTAVLGLWQEGMESRICSICGAKVRR